jgi:hypothetical protein
MKRIRNDLYTFQTANGERYDAVFSEDDGGWYLQRHADDAVSRIFPTRQAAALALVTGAVDWTDIAR